MSVLEKCPSYRGYFNTKCIYVLWDIHRKKFEGLKSFRCDQNDKKGQNISILLKLKNMSYMRTWRDQFNIFLITKCDKLYFP